MKTEMEQQDTPWLVCGNVAAGFPSPAETYVEKPLDLNNLLIYRPAATFFVRACGDSITARDGSVIIAVLDGDFTVKQFRRGRDGSAWLVPANPQFEPINVTERQDFSVFGVVTACIHQFVHEHVRK